MHHQIDQVKQVIVARWDSITNRKQGRCRMNMTLHTHTPTITTLDSRHLPLSHIAFRRNGHEQPVDRLISHRAYDSAGRLVGESDARLGADTPLSNRRSVYGLRSEPVATDSVDSGWRLVLHGEAGQALYSWDGRGGQRTIEYDALVRPVVIIELDRITERFSYGGPDAFAHNQCSRIIRHDDPAGSLLVMDYSLPGSVLNETRSFLQEPVTPDWPLANSARDALLENERFDTQWTVNALAEVIEQTDARGNAQHFGHTVAGQLNTVELKQPGAVKLQVLVSQIRYSALAQIEQETAGNGVISHYAYDPHTGRLNELLATSADGVTVQKLTYAYDPVGNVLGIEGAAHLDNNPCVDPVSHYTYDTLYQLIEAKGFEVKTDTSHGPGLPGMQNLPPDPNQVGNYTQTYDYDAAGNLLTMHHVGEQSFTRTMRVAPDSNRSLPEGEVDTDFADSFDANGNLLQLVRGQSLSWDVRNQLQQIITVQRETGLDDEERYVYDGQGQRVRKINSAQASGRTLINEVRYLPGLEIRTTADGENTACHHGAGRPQWRTGVALGSWQT